MVSLSSCPLRSLCKALLPFLLVNFSTLSSCIFILASNTTNRMNCGKGQIQRKPLPIRRPAHITSGVDETRGNGKPRLLSSDRRGSLLRLLYRLTECSPLSRKYPNSAFFRAEIKLDYLFIVPVSWCEFFYSGNQRIETTAVLDPEKASRRRQQSPILLLLSVLPGCLQWLLR